jgi:hypothetical protein
MLDISPIPISKIYILVTLSGLLRNDSPIITDIYYTHVWCPTAAIIADAVRIPNHERPSTKEHSDLP